MKRMLSAVFAVAWCVAGCGGGGSSATAPAALDASHGNLALALIDAPSTQVSSIFVTVADVRVHSAQSGWTEVYQGGLTFDLLTLKSQAAGLGIVSLPAGSVDQIRLVLDPNGPQYVVLPDGTQAPLKVPSGTESGIKLIGNFEVKPCNTHTVTIDFDGEHSIFTHPTGHGDEWILRPVVRVKAETDQPATCDSDAGTPGETDAGTPADDAGTPVPDAGIIIN